MTSSMGFNRTVETATQKIYEAEQAGAVEKANQNLAEQLETEDNMNESLSEAVNPSAASLTKKAESMKDRIKTYKEQLKGEGEDKVITAVAEAGDSDSAEREADTFAQQDPDLKEALLRLKGEIKEGDSSEAILAKLQTLFKDPDKADTAFKFLMATMPKEQLKDVEDAQKQFQKLFQRETKMANEASAATRTSLAANASIKDIYADLLQNHREASKLFEELSEKYTFVNLQKVINSIMHLFGNDFRKNAKDMSRGEQHTLFTELRSLQAIMGVYRFFRGRMKLISKMYAQDGLKVPAQITFEALAKEFIQLTAERYLSEERVLQIGNKLGIRNSPFECIIILSQMRDAVREVSLSVIYRSLTHRDELFMAVIAALEYLEDEADRLVEKDTLEEESNPHAKNAAAKAA